MIRYVQIFGERNSGTNYLLTLLKMNVVNQDVEFGFKFGWKHGFTNRGKIHGEPTGEVLFLLITKNPYAWLVSMNRKPHHAPQLYFKNLSEFLRSEWACYHGKGYQLRAKQLNIDPVKPEEEMMNERDPVTKLRFKNVIELRNAKNRYHLELERLVENFQHLRYEDLLKDPNSMLQKIACRFTMKLKSNFQDSAGHHGLNPSKRFDSHRYYQEGEYLRAFIPSDLSFVNNSLDWDLENKLGYEPFLINQILD